jgi:hypothetical protein
VEAVKLHSLLEQMQIQFTVKESKTAVFEALIVFGSERKGFLTCNKPFKIPSLPYVYRGYPAILRIMSIGRKDTYAGECEEFAKGQELNLPELCICH